MPHPDPPGSTDDLSLLHRRLERERARRRAAEDIGEQVTADLFETVEELRSIQADLVERADRSRVVNEVARELRQELDAGRLLERAARAVGEATEVDRCQVHVVHPATLSGAWTRPGCTLPDPLPLAAQPGPLRDLLDDAERRREGLQVDDLGREPRLPRPSAERLAADLGVRALVAAPMRVGNHLVGWVTLQRRDAHAWQDRDLALSASLAGDLGATVLQVLAYQQQAESMRRLRELDRAKDAFISTVSHELRTPLTSISGYVELIADGDYGPLSPDLERAVEVVGRSTERLRVLVEDLLTLSAYDADGLRLDRTSVDLSALVAECHDSLKPTLARRDLEVRVLPEPGLRPVLADRGQLERVVLNLLTNAVKFTPDGGTVVVSAANAGDGVRLVVEDTGIGIPAAEQERLFTRFFRSSLSISSEIRGTGLGLAVSRTLVEQHGGTIEIASAEGEGTRVTVLLPCAPTD